MSDNTEKIDLIDSEDFTGAEERPWTQQPMPRVVLASIGAAFAAIVLFYLIGGFGGNSQTASTSSDMESGQVADGSQPTDSKDEIIEQLKIERAMTAQNSQPETFKLEEDKPDPPPPQPTAKSPPPAAVVRPVAAPPRPAPPPQVQPVRSIAPQRVVLPRPMPAARPAPQPAPRPAPVAVQPQPKEDPMDAWVRLAGLGSYRGTAPESNSYASAASGYTPAVYSQTSSETEPQSSDGLYASDRSIADGSFQQPIAPTLGVTLAAGTNVKARLLTPIMWASDLDISNQEYLVELKDDLAPTLPKGTLLTVQSEQTSSAGFVRLKAIRASINGSEHSLPDSIKIMGASGGLIKASKKGTGGRGAGSIIAGALLSGISKGAGEFLKPDSQSFTGGNGFTQIVTNNQSNPWAGVAQGATENLADGFQSQLDQGTQGATPYYQVSEGTGLKVMVTQSVQL